MQPKKGNRSEQDQLIEDLASFVHDPVGWLYYAFDWGTGELKDKEPDPWQIDILDALGKGLLTPGEAIQVAIASGHGIGKSAIVAWIILWSMSTFENTKGVVTANTENQLKTKTWTELGKWFSRFIGKELFEFTATAVHIKDPDIDRQKQWRIDMVPWSEKNTEAFAGMHNEGKRILVIFDEASAISNLIWEVSEGALTDDNTEIIWCCFGNPTRNSGRFYDCFHKDKHLWINRQIDSRTVKITNKKQIAKWEEKYGADSDFFKVRVRGLFPSTSSSQFISTDIVDAAMGKQIHAGSYNFAPKIIGVDPAYSGEDEFAVYLRQGLAAQLLGTFHKLEDDFKAAGYIAQWQDEHQADAVFVDMGYGTGIVSAAKAMGRQWQLVAFGSSSMKPGYLNKRAEMWGDMKDWLKAGGCIPNDPTICDELKGPEGWVNLKGQIQLESKDDMKERGVASPNRADALALTFAFPVQKKNIFNKPEFAKKDYDPLA